MAASPPSHHPLQAKGRTSEAITKLCSLAPPAATLVQLDSKGAVAGERELPTDLVHRGDLLKVGPVCVCVCVCVCRECM